MQLLDLSPERLEEARRHLPPEEKRELDALLLSMDFRPMFRDEAFPEQTAFIADPSRTKCLLCSRRAGKSFGFARYLCEVAYDRPGCSVLYVALTRDSVKKAIWKDGLKVLVPLLGLKATFNESELTVTLDNGSVIYCMGADASEKVKERIRGGKYALVIVDEAASFTNDLADIYSKIVKPAVADYNGTICLGGTPGDFHAGLFYELSQEQDPSVPGTWTVAHQGTAALWSGHRWNTFVNPYMRAQWTREIDEEIAVNPLIVDTPAFKQERLGLWTINENFRVYAWRPGLMHLAGPVNEFVELPRVDARWHHVLGIDLGYNDATAFAVIAYHDESKDIYVLEDYRQSGMVMPDVVVKLRELAGRYKFERKVIDGASKQLVETMRRMYPDLVGGAEAAEKQGKFDFIKLVNGMYLTGNLKLGPNTHGLRAEIPKLIWDKDTTPWKEKEGLPNDTCDALLYAVRASYAYLGKKPEPGPALGSPEWNKLEADRMKEQARREAQRARDARRVGDPFNPFRRGGP